jgi:hypothetical protein
MNTPFAVNGESSKGLSSSSKGINMISKFNIQNFTDAKNNYDENQNLKKS